MVTVAGALYELSVMPFIMIPLGIVMTFTLSHIGIPLAIDIYGAPAILGLLFIITAIPFGLVKRNHIYGQVLVVAGVCLWSILSMFGLGNAG